MALKFSDPSEDYVLPAVQKSIPGATRFVIREWNYGQSVQYMIQVGEPPNHLRHMITAPLYLVENPGDWRVELRPVTDEVREEWAEREKDAEDDGHDWSRPQTFRYNGQTLYEWSGWASEPTYKDQPRPDLADVVKLFKGWLEDMANRGEIARKALDS